MKEPLIHSGITDGLPKDHPLNKLAETQDGIDCIKCGTMVHCLGAAGDDLHYGECMRTWVETSEGAYCLPCLAKEEESSGYSIYHLGLPD